MRRPRPAVLRRLGTADRGHAGPSARPPASISGRTTHRRNRQVDRFRCERPRPLRGTLFGPGDRRPVDPQDGRDRPGTRRWRAASAWRSPRRALACVPLRRKPPLSGPSLEVVASAAARPASARPPLFTHRGLSGPAILQVGLSYWRRRRSPSTCPARPRGAKRPLLERKRSDRRRNPPRAGGWLPQRRRQEPAPAGPGPARPTRAAGAGGPIAKAGWSRRPAPEGYAKAEVTVGGVDTAACRRARWKPTRFPACVIGEAVDVTGWLGGSDQWPGRRAGPASRSDAAAVQWPR